MACKCIQWRMVSNSGSIARQIFSEIDEEVFVDVSIDKRRCIIVLHECKLLFGIITVPFDTASGVSKYFGINAIPCHECFPYLVKLS